MKHKIILIITLIICSTTFGQITEANYKIYSTKLQKEVSIKDIIIEMENNDVLFYGEEHNDSVTHFLEYKILEEMNIKFPNKIALSLEMFDREVQRIMNEYLSGLILEKHFKKDARVWSNYSDYRQMVELAKKNKFSVLCANAPTRYTNIAGRFGQKALEKLSLEAKKYIAPLPYDTATGLYHDKLSPLSTQNMKQVSDSSTSKMPANKMQSFNLVMAQSLWDATMAYTIFEYSKQNIGIKIFHVNGRFHSDEKFAVVTQLKKYSPKTKILNISSFSDDSFPNIDWEKYKHLGDYIIITDPKVPRTY